MPQAVIAAAIVAAGTLATQGAIAAAVVFVTTLGLKLLQGIVNSRPDIETVVRNQARPGAPMWVPYGTTKMGMQVADIRDDPNNEIDLHTVRALCVGSEDAAADVGQTNGGDIGGVRKVWFDEEIALDAVDSGWDGSGFNGGLTDNHLPEQNLGESIKGIIDDPWVGGEGDLRLRFDYALKLGGIDQGTDVGDPGGRVSGIHGVWPTAWPTTSQGDGLAWFNFLLRQEPDPENRGTFRGLPNFTAEVDGRRVYDPRDGTWKHTNNPALCILDYLTSKMVGFDAAYPERDGGSAPSQIDEDSFITAANYCDELVEVPDNAGGTTTQKRYTCDVALDTSASLKQNLAILESSCNGHVIWQEGKYRLWIRQPQAPVDLTLDEDNIVGDWQFKRLGSGDVSNSLTVQFPDKDRDYTTQEITWPRPGDPNPYLDTDNGVKEESELRLHATTDAHRAERIASTLLREERADLRVALTATEEALQLQVGDLVPITHDLPGWTEKPFWVEAMTVGQNFQVQLALREYDADAYARPAQEDRDDVPESDLPSEQCAGTELPDFDNDLAVYLPFDEATNRSDGVCGMDEPYGPYRFDVSGNGNTGFVEKQTGVSSYVIWDTSASGDTCDSISLSWDDGRCFSPGGIADAHDGGNPLALVSGSTVNGLTNDGGGFAVSGSFKFNAVQGKHSLFGQKTLSEGWSVTAQSLDDTSGAEIRIDYNGDSTVVDISPITAVADFLEDSATTANNNLILSDAEWYDIGVIFAPYIDELNVGFALVVMNGFLQGVAPIGKITASSKQFGFGSTGSANFTNAIRGAYDQLWVFDSAISFCELSSLQKNLCGGDADDADVRDGNQVQSLTLEQTALDTCSGGGGLDLKLTPGLENLPEGGSAIIQFSEDGTLRATITESDLFDGSTERTYTHNKSGVGSDASSTVTHIWKAEMFIKDRNNVTVDSGSASVQTDAYGTC